MKPQQTYVVLATRGTGWEIHGPLAQEYRTLKDAETAARDLSIRYPQQTIGVYELRFVFGTQQKVVKHAVEATAQPIATKRKTRTELPTSENVIKLRNAE